MEISSLRCTCNPLADEHCDHCRNRHKLTGQALIPYEKTTNLLSVENVCLSFQGRPVLRDVNVKIRKVIFPGDGKRKRVVAFLGPSGIGKTQFLRMAAGLQAPTSGGIYFTEERHVAVPGLCGLVMQQYPLFRNRTVLGNLEVAAAQHNGDSSKVHTERAIDFLKRFNMEDKANMYPSQLSGGQKQRISVGQQLLTQEEDRCFLLMDEPTAGLDPVSKKKVCALVTDIASNGDGIIIVVTHDVPTAAAIADTIWLMGRDRDEEGKIIPGARIVDTYDLIECGLAWNPNSRTHPAYAPLVQELNTRFDEL